MSDALRWSSCLTFFLSVGSDDSLSLFRSFCIKKDSNAFPDSKQGSASMMKLLLFAPCVIFLLPTLCLAQLDDDLYQSKLRVKPPVPATVQQPQQELDPNAGVYTRLNPDYLHSYYASRRSGSTFRTIEREASDLDQQQRRRPVLRPTLTGDADPRSRDPPYNSDRRWSLTPPPKPSSGFASYRSDDAPSGPYQRFFPQEQHVSQRKVPIARPSTIPSSSGLKRPQAPVVQEHVIPPGVKSRRTRQLHISPSIPLRCLQEVKLGACDATIRRFAYNSLTGNCEPFDYKGCRGNRNNFVTERECLKSCGLSKDS